jgi:hypothetical protein
MATATTPTIERTIEQTTERVTELNDHAVKVGLTTVEAYEKTGWGFAQLQTQLAKTSQVDWLTSLLDAQADFTRTVVSAQASAARSILS